MEQLLSKSWWLKTGEEMYEVNACVLSDELLEAFTDNLHVQHY
jgi:hypothetical protein